MPLLPQPVAATAALSRAWRGPLPLLGAKRSSSLSHHIGPLSRSSAPRSTPYCSTRQMRCYSSSGRRNIATSSPTTATGSQDGTAKNVEVENSEPLRILFCGSDEFSCAALEALHREHERNPDLIQSIDVVARPGKRTGRGYKAIRNPPIRELATQLELPVHERDTFTGWDMPPHINLIIAVSFGLFVPARLLRASRYGGLNLHPSALPDLRGPAPLQHALLAGRASTSVSLQTLDPEAFDRGLVLARSEPIGIPEDATFESLRDDVAPRAAGLLVGGLRRGVHVPPLRQEEVVVDPEETEEETQQQHAPKITKQDRLVRPERVRGDARDLWRRFRALGPLWFYSRDRRGARRRVIVEEMSMPAPARHLRHLPDDGKQLLLISDTAAASSSPPPSLSALVSTYGDEVTRRTDENETGVGKFDLRGYGDGMPYLIPLEVGDFDSDPDPAVSAPGVDGSTGTGTATTTTKDSYQGDVATSKPKRRTATYLVLGVLGSDDINGGACWLGGCRIETVKVEGERAKPAAQALKDFLISWDQWVRIRGTGGGGK
ncbi:Formyltransferase [Hypoxylon sp. FL1150]|nr:Formyltransferase [Hypoxylon sp. FL1150]